MRPRTLRMSLSGATLAELRIPGAYRRYSVEIPAGIGPAKLQLQAIPGAQPASAVTPGDKRVLAITLREPRLTPAR